MRLTTALSILAASVIACGRPADSAPVVHDSTFVAAMAQLYAIDSSRTLDSAARAAARRRVLSEHGLTPNRLEQAARRLADDPKRASDVWSAIHKRLTKTDQKPKAGLKGPTPRLKQPPRPITKRPVPRAPARPPPAKKQRGDA